MASRISAPVVTRGGYTICEIYEIDENGEEQFIGFGVFDPDGNPVHIASDYESAYAFLDGLIQDNVIESTSGPKPGV